MKDLLYLAGTIVKKEKVTVLLASSKEQRSSFRTVGPPFIADNISGLNSVRIMGKAEGTNRLHKQVLRHKMT